MALQLLEHQKRVGEKVYRYYSIAEPYREKGKNKKRILTHLGPLEAEQVLKIRQALRLAGNSSLELIDPGTIDCTGSWSFLNVSVFHQLWKQLKIEKVVGCGEADVDLCKLFEILVLNRCVQPTSKLGISRWYPTTALDRILKIDASSINESRVYRALSAIESHHRVLEEHLFSHLNEMLEIPLSSIYFYDLTSSYFEGQEVALGAFSKHSKDHRPDLLQVVLGLLINEKGVPFSWDVMRGNQGDAPVLIEQVKHFKKRFKIEKALLVFDRGFLSHDNLEAVERAGYEYLTGLKRPQIETIFLKHPQPWIAKITTDNVEEIIQKQEQWQRFSPTSFYCPIGAFNGKKTVLLFDTERYRRTVLRRQDRIEELKKWIMGHNQRLANFKKDAAKSAIERDVDTEIKRRKLEGYVSYELHTYVTKNETFQRKKNNPYPSQGHMRKIRSFQILAQENNRNPLDGVFALVTPEKSTLEPEEMMTIYRQKYLIESAFREMKSILKLRPWFVYKEEHVKAHYTICVMAFILERLLDLLLELHHCKEDGWTLGNLKEQLSKYHLVQFEIRSSQKRHVLQNIPQPLASVIKRIGLGAALKLPS